MSKKGDKENAAVESELAELHRRYRLMEGDRKAYTEESQAIIRRQRAAIEKLKQDNEQLREELALESRSNIGSANMSATQQLTKLQESVDDYETKLNDEKSRHEDLNKQVNLLNARILEARQSLGGVNASKDNSAAIGKQIRILENRLEKALVKFNEALANNKALRESIDNLRRERVVFDGIYKKLEKELNEKKKEMANIIEVSNSAYESRDEAQSKMAELKEKSEKELSSFETELRELSRQIEQDRKMKAFMNLKQDKVGDMNKEEEGKLKKQKKKGQWDYAKDKVHAQVNMEKVQSYEEAFAKIQSATGISDIDELVNTFIKVEDQNFSLFNYVNELNNEIEKLEEQISDIKNEIEKHKGQGASTDNQRKKILKDLEEKLSRTESKAEQYEVKFNENMTVVNDLKSGIQSLFSRIGCSTSQLSEMLGNQGVTESNMMQYLGIIEQRTNEILQGYSTVAAGEVSSILGHGPQAPVGATHVVIEPPSTGDDYDSDDYENDEEEERPLTRDELRARTMRGLAKTNTKRDNGAAKGKNKRR